jgi:hypothetical protein
MQLSILHVKVVKVSPHLWSKRVCTLAPFTQKRKWIHRRSFLLSVRKGIELRLRPTEWFAFLSTRLAITTIPENTVFSYITLIHTFFYTQSNLKSYFESNANRRQRGSRHHKWKCNYRPTCSEVNSKLTTLSPGSCAPEYYIGGLKQAELCNGGAAADLEEGPAPPPFRPKFIINVSKTQDWRPKCVNFFFFCFFGGCSRPSPK